MILLSFVLDALCHKRSSMKLELRKFVAEVRIVVSAWWRLASRIGIVKKTVLRLLNVLQ